MCDSKIQISSKTDRGNNDSYYSVTVKILSLMTVTHICPIESTVEKQANHAMRFFNGEKLNVYSVFHIKILRIL